MGCARKSSWAMFCLFSLMLASPAWAQGILLPHHPRDHWPLPRPIVRTPPPVASYSIREIAVQTRIQDQVARTQVSQTFVNTGSQRMEVSFVFPLPYDGAIDRLTLLVDGKEYDAKLMTKEEARRIYEGYVRRNQDPALLEWMGAGMFQTSVFPLPPGQERKVSLRYSQLLRKDCQLTDFLFPLSTAKYTSQPLERLALEVSIESSSPIKSVYSPTHAITLERGDDLHAVAKFEARGQIPSNDFRLFYDTSASPLGSSVLSHWPQGEDHGYFLLLTSPEITDESSTKQSKNTIFVIDRSGSMSGKKMEQAKEALKFVLQNLRDGDLFNIIAYDSDVESFRPELQRYDEATRQQAVGFINGLFAGGSTNIDGALTTALSMIQDDSRPHYVVFLTDGKPTAGNRNEGQIVENSRRHNQYGARLISLGVGFDVNSRLIDRLSRANRGQSEFVRPDEDIEAYVSRLYRQIAAPVMVDVAINIDLEQTGAVAGKPTNRVYPQEVHDIFAGQQLTLAGRYNASGAARITIAGKVNGDERTFTFPASFAAQSDSQSYAFVEKIWASRRIGQIIDQLDLEGQNEELVNELVELSVKHGILTPYTSFLADDQARPAELADDRFGRQLAESLVSRLGEAEGAGGFRQRESKRRFQVADRLPSAQSLSASRVDGPAAPAGVLVTSIDSDEVRATNAVLQVGNETLFRRGRLLIAANAREVDLEQDGDQIVNVARYSDAYFRLVAANRPAENAVLARQAVDEELIVRLRGQVYRIQ